MPSSWEQSRIEIGMSTKRPMELAIVNRAAAVDVESFKECVAPDEGGTQCSSELIRAHQSSSELIRGTQHAWKSASHMYGGTWYPRAIRAHSRSSELISVAHVRRHVVPESGQSLS